MPKQTSNLKKKNRGSKRVNKQGLKLEIQLKNASANPFDIINFVPGDHDPILEWAMQNIFKPAYDAGHLLGSDAIFLKDFIDTFDELVFWRTEYDKQKKKLYSIERKEAMKAYRQWLKDLRELMAKAGMTPLDRMKLINAMGITLQKSSVAHGNSSNYGGKNVPKYKRY
ncbi:MAG: hypothetical protein HRT89_03265 [Lentisphaeria bacterium]|nr:hypothetical protein [Lentisphaeria bacterium]NQZ67070.1 hypothetical protein [Lentisphaeria bacterium]